MSYTLTPYLIDLGDLRRAVESRDEALLDAIREGRPEVFAEDEADEGDADEEEIPLREALRHLVMGEARRVGSAHQYGYALEALCARLGERLDADCWESIRWQVLETTGMDQVLKSGPPVELPPNDSFPAIGFLTPEQISAIVARMEKGPLKTAAPSGKKPRRSFGSWLLGLVISRIIRRGPLTDEDVRELLEEYEGWLREAESRNKALVFFYQ